MTVEHLNVKVIVNAQRSTGSILEGEKYITIEIESEIKTYPILAILVQSLFDLLALP